MSSKSKNLHSKFIIQAKLNLSNIVLRLFSDKKAYFQIFITVIFNI